jgi:hypothetical protein
VLGTASTTLGSGSANLIDTINQVEVVLSCPDQLLLNADDHALAMGSNLMLLGDELVQFGRAEEMAPGRYRLSRLLRGRRGTEWAIGAHSAGERMLLIDRATLVAIELNPAMRGGAVEAAAFGVADDRQNPPTASIMADGESLRPPPPCRLAIDQGGGGLAISWLSRCRDGWAWVDGAGDCHNDNRQFEVELIGAVGSWRGQTAATSLAINPAILAGLGEGAVTIGVSELSAATRSRAVKAVMANS